MPRPLRHCLRDRGAVAAGLAPSPRFRSVPWGPRTGRAVRHAPWRRLLLVAGLAGGALAPASAGPPCAAPDAVHWTGPPPGRLCPTDLGVLDIAPGLAPGDRRFHATGADGRTLFVDLTPAGRVRQVVLGERRCVADACGGVTVRWDVDALQARADQVFGFSGTVLAAPDRGLRPWRLNGVLRVPLR